MGSFQSLHANREARDPLPIVIVAVDMPLGVYAASSTLFFFFSFYFSKEWLAAFQKPHNPNSVPPHEIQRAHDPSAADNSPPPPQLAEVSSP